MKLVIAEKPSVAQTIAAALGVKGKQDGYIEGGGYLISASGTAPVTIEGVRCVGNSAGGNGGAVYNQSAYCTIKSLEMANNTAAAGTAGLFSAVVAGWAASGAVGSTPVTQEIVA